MKKFYTNVARIGDNICVIERDYDGGLHVKKEKFQPTFYIKDNTGKDSGWKSLRGVPMRAVKHAGIKEASNFIREHSDISNFEIGGMENFIIQYISENYKQNDKVIEYDSSAIKIFSIDIETETEHDGFPEPDKAREKILLITVMDAKSKKITTFGTKPYNGDKDVDYRLFSDEEDMLSAFIDFWVANRPDIVTGWNICDFDIPYLVNRIKMVVGDYKANKLSPWGKISEAGNFTGKSGVVVDIVGLSQLDYLVLYKRYSMENRESYKLDYIAEEELGENKLVNPYSRFKDFYANDWDLFVNYNIHDTVLIDKLEEKLNFIGLHIEIAYLTGVNFEDGHAQTKMWDSVFYNYLKSKGITIPAKKSGVKKSGKYAGAFVKETITGKHNWVATFDLSSLYPHLIMQYSVSPENLITRESIHKKYEAGIKKGSSEFAKDMKALLNLMDTVTPDRLVKREFDTTVLKKYNIGMAANGSLFKNETGFIPVLMEKFFDDRKSRKTEMIEMEKLYEKTGDLAAQDKAKKLFTSQWALKIILNAAYGSIGTPYFRYFDIRLAESITLSSQLAIKWIHNHLNEFLNKAFKTEGVDYIIASDTDSIMVKLEKVAETVCGKKCDEIKKIEGKLKTDIDNEEAKKELLKLTGEVIDVIDKFCHKIINPRIEKWYEEMAEYVNAYQNKMFMKREKLCDKTLFLGKKKYIARVYDSEGVRYNTPKVNSTGIEMIKSSTPAPVKAKKNEVIKLLLDGNEDDAIKFNRKFKDEFKKLPPEEISFPRGVNDLEKWADGKTIYKKGRSTGTPIHVRGSLLYNHHIEKNKIADIYPKIQPGDKIKFIYLKLPNVINEDVIAFSGTLPKEFNLHDNIDYDKQYEKAFENVLNILIKPMEWDLNKRLGGINFLAQCTS